MFLKNTFVKGNLSSFLSLILSFPPQKQPLLPVSWVTFQLYSAHAQVHAETFLFFKTTLNYTLTQGGRKNLLQRKVNGSQVSYQLPLISKLVPEEESEALASGTK